NAPLVNTEDKLYTPNIPRADGPGCMTRTVYQIARPTLTETVQEIISQFWGAEFGNDWYGPPKLEDWILGTRINPNWAMENFLWREHSMSLGNVCKSMFVPRDTAQGNQHLF